MTRRTGTLLFLAGAIAYAQQTSSQIYTAIRGNDLPALRTLVQAQGVNVPDSRGQTPLMIAAAYGSLEVLEFLLASGADAKAVSGFGVTALHWAAGDIRKVRLLLDKGVDVNAKSEIGRTPLLIAAGTHGASEVVKALLAKGAQIETPDAQGLTPLQTAAAVGDLNSVRLLLDRGADPNVRAGNGFTALMSAAGNGNVDMVRLLLARKADPNAVSGETNGGGVKNGPIAIGFMTPLHWAAVTGGPEVVKLLLDAGAVVDKLDVRGMTALMSSVAIDDANPATVRMLLAKGSDPNIKSKAGETTFDWARKFNNPAVLPLLKLQAEAPRAAVTAVADTRPSVTPRQAVERALPPVQRAADYIFKDSGCVACHAQPVAEMATNLARARGWRVDEALSKQSLDSIRNGMITQAQPLLQAREVGGMPDSLLYMLLSAAANKMAPNPGTDAVVHFLAAKQRAAGNWQGIGGSRAPIQDGHFSRTALGIRALSVYGIPARKAEFDERIARAAKWLAKETPFATEPRVMQLLGLHWASAEPKLQASRTKELVAQQRADGGWAQNPFLETDAYATAQVLYTLHELGTPASDAAFRRGVDYLLRTQKADGTWFVKNRAMKLQPYFESGFPYEHDQWISTSATAWASMALSLSEPERATVAAAPAR